MEATGENARCSTQVQYNENPGGGFDYIDVCNDPVSIGDYTLTWLEPTRNDFGIYGWSGRWGDGEGFGEGTPGPANRHWGARNGNHFSAEANPGWFHDLCRKRLRNGEPHRDGAPVPETRLQGW